MKHSGTLSGRITRVDGDAAWARVPKLGAGERGPLTVLRHRLVIPGVQEPVLTAMPQVGDRVYLAPIEGSSDRLVILGVAP